MSSAVGLAVRKTKITWQLWWCLPCFGRTPFWRKLWPII